MELTAADVRVLQSSWEPQAVVLRLTEPKNNSCLGRFQFTSIHDGGIVASLRWLTAGMEPAARLWLGSHALFTACWKICVGQLGYESLGITQGSLRPGCATHHFLQHQSIASLRIAGRWRADSSLEHYIQLVMPHLCLRQLSDSAHAYAAELAHITEHQWHLPPAKPWSQVFSRARQWQGLAVAERRKLSQQNSGTSRAASKAFAASISQP